MNEEMPKTMIAAAAKWLRGLGICQITLELAHWAPGQKSLLA